MKNYRLLFVCVTVVGLGFVGAGAALGQSLGANGIHPVVGKPKGDAGLPPAPSGLPGARAPEGGVAPAQVPPSDMQPNDALFDAINRGDIVTARDAMSRGADLNARSILGMTPLELSVDLGRNDITFYLLSLRGADTSAPQLAKTPAAAPAAPKLAKKTVHAPRVVAAQPAPRQTAAESQYASGGTPDPNAGFLGFGGTQIR